MTDRTTIATAAMSAMLGNSSMFDLCPGVRYLPELAMNAFDVADAMIEESEKGD